MEKNLFEVATRKAYRFQSTKGLLTVEDLWQLSTKSLDDIYKKLNAEKKTAEEESLLSTKSAGETDLDNKIEIIKYIVEVKLKELEDRKNAAAVKARNERIMEMIKEKEDEELKKMTKEELLALLDK